MAARNPLAAPDEFYIIHTRKPRFIAQRIKRGEDVNIEVVDFIDDMKHHFGGDAQKMVGLMRRMGDWYTAFCNWEKENRNGGK